MIVSLCWVPQSATAGKPRKYRLTKDEYERIMALTKSKADEARDQMQQRMTEMAIDRDRDATAGEAEEDVESKYNLHDYDQYEANSEDSDHQGDKFKEALLSRVDELLELDEDGKEPQGDAAEGDDDEEAESDVEDVTLHPTDRILVCGQVKDGVSYLNMYVYDESEDHNLYVHHDIMLPSLPLCVQSINHPLSPDTPDRNYIAVGSFEPDIEIWNMDVLDAGYPSAILKGHKDAVMSLSWNRHVPHLLASGSADKSICIWNLDHCCDPDKALIKRVAKAARDKVQTLQWCPHQPALLASASYDKTIALLDSRTFKQEALMANASHDPECLRWNPFADSEVYCSDEGGSINVVDIRSPMSFVKTIEAHQKPCTGIDFHSVVPGLLLSASVDRSVKVWDVKGAGTCLLSREPAVGKLFSASFALDSPFLIACAGSHGELAVVNVDDSDSFRDFVQHRLTN